MSDKNILEVKDLVVKFKTDYGEVTAVNKLNFSLKKGETLGIVGESGSGKSQASFALMGLLANNGYTQGEALFHGKDLLTLPQPELNKIRGNKIAMIFQDPMTSINPFLTIGKQLNEVLILHKGYSEKQAFEESVRILDAVKMPESRKRMTMYPHEFSGGMRQRVMIAMALLCNPELLIADEPTTALDVTVQAQIMTLIADIQKDLGTSIILITHDLGVVAGVCDKVMVMYGGRTMEYGNSDEIFYSPSHPYTQGLLSAIPRVDSSESKLLSIPGNPPNLLNLPVGCPFEPRCAHAFAECKKAPELTKFDAGRSRACFVPVEKLEFKLPGSDTSV